MVNAVSNPLLAGEVERARVVVLLARHLLAAPGVLAPGVDGATVEDVVETGYLTASAAGKVPPPVELAASHPELAGAILSFFRARLALVGMAC